MLGVHPSYVIHVGWDILDEERLVERWERFRGGRHVRFFVVEDTVVRICFGVDFSTWLCEI